MASVVGLVKRVYTTFNPPIVPSIDKPIKFGILGAAAIAPIALITPVISHPEVTVLAVAARDKTRAEAFAKKYKIPKAYGGPSGYQELLDDPDIDAIYNPLPNGLHYEWTYKALAAGKHVLLEKPSTNTAEETRKLFDFAERKSLVLLEAFHYRFHPAIQRVRRILDSGDLGAIKGVSVDLTLTKGIIRGGDIRFDYSLGGGAMMDLGCYTMNCIRYLSSSNPTSVLDATPTLTPSSDQIDRAMTATLALPNSATAKLKVDLAVPFRIIPPFPELRAVVECEKGTVEIFNFIAPTFYHHIRVTSTDGNKKVTTGYKEYISEDDKAKGEVWWTTYRYQLEAFVDKIKGRTPQTWVTAEDSVDNLKWVEEVYAKAGLKTRPKSTCVLETD